MKWIAIAVTALAMACTGGAPIGGRPDAQPVYLDVRTASEYQAGHLRGALNIPHDQVADRLAEIERYREREVIVYCRSGRRSAIALEILQRAGFARAVNGGSFEGLVEAGAAVD